VKVPAGAEVLNLAPADCNTLPGPRPGGHPPARTDAGPRVPSIGGGSPARGRRAGSPERRGQLGGARAGSTRRQGGQPALRRPAATWAAAAEAARADANGAGVLPAREDGGGRGSGGDGLHPASLTGRVEDGLVATRGRRIGGPRPGAGAGADAGARPAEPAGGRPHAGRRTHVVLTRRLLQGSLAAVRRRVGRPLQPGGGSLRVGVAVVVRPDVVHVREDRRGRRGPPRVGAVGDAILGPAHEPHAGRGDAAGGIPDGVVAYVSTEGGGPLVRASRRCAAPGRD